MTEFHDEARGLSFKTIEPITQADLEDWESKFTLPDKVGQRRSALFLAALEANLIITPAVTKPGFKELDAPIAQWYGEQASQVYLDLIRPTIKAEIQTAERITEGMLEKWENGIEVKLPIGTYRGMLVRGAIQAKVLLGYKAEDIDSMDALKVQALGAALGEIYIRLTSLDPKPSGPLSPLAEATKANDSPTS